MDPLSILPEELWLYVFQNLKTHTDMQAAYNTCRLWRRLLERRKTLWKFKNIFPLIRQYLSKSDILEARMVCKSWKAVIESYLENGQPTEIAPGGALVFSPHLPTPTLAVCFAWNARRLGLTNPMEVLQYFQSEFETEHASTNNPFVSRSLHFNVTKMNSAIVEFFKTFGLHLFSLKLCILQRVSQEITSLVEIGTFIFKILAHLPNVRKLDLKIVQNFGSYPECSPGKMEARELGLFLRENEAPPLPHLKELQLDVHPLLLQAFEAAYAPQLETFAHVMFRKSFETRQEPLQAHWYFTQGDCPVKHLKMLKSRESQSLQRLHVHMIEFEWKQWHYLLYETVQSYKYSLTHLTLSWETFEPRLPKQLNLPFLQELHLEIGCWNDPKNLNFYFLPQLISLRKLKCVFWNDAIGYEELLDFYRDSEKPKDMLTSEGYVDLQYHLYDDSHGGPYKSNVWQLVPSLERIEIRFIKYMPVRSITLYKFYTRARKGK